MNGYFISKIDMLSHVSSVPTPPESLFFGWACLKDLYGAGNASNAERGGDSVVANVRQDGGECREGERTTSSPPSTANRYRMDTQDTYDSSSQSLCYNSNPGELNLISFWFVVSVSASVAMKTAAAASSGKDDRCAVAVRSRVVGVALSELDGQSGQRKRC